jgi:lipid II:glycine glycyltransferase (peptidoglycan interpeptide bridge formation enzyme)
LSSFSQGSNAFVSLLIGQREFSIPLNQLHMKKEQLYKFSKKGIANVIENDIYNVSSKADIIVRIQII